ncbi:MAG: hypothetical protein U9N61_08135 [Euryarchaeota archaeon]|nr:hypothetical protein [Euryarchaeota archaeon]
MSKVSLTQAVRNESVEEIVAAVNAAVSVYAAPQPPVPTINTAFGSMRLDNAMVDNDTKIVVAGTEVAHISIAAEALPDDGVKEIEIAKLIATNPLLRNLEATATGGLL